MHLNLKSLAEPCRVKMTAALFLRSEEVLCPDIQLPSGCQVNLIDQKDNLPYMKDIVAGGNWAGTFDRVER